MSPVTQQGLTGAWATRLLRLGLLLLAAWLTGCAAPHQASAPGAAHWQGRLALKVYSVPVQALSADFDLQGDASQGSLTLSTPLGTTLARMQWDGAAATLHSQGQVRAFASLAEMAQQLTGTALPVSSLFAWLRGQAEAAPGWEVDLSDLPHGRLQAHHTEAVQAELRIVLEP